MQIVGTVICALVGIRLMQSIVNSLQTHAVAELSAAQSLALLDEQIAATKALRIQREYQSLHWNGYRKFRVGRKVDEADGIASLYLLPHDKKPLPGYQPGQYLTFRFQLPDETSGELKPVVRCYSLSDAPHQDHFRITVKRVPAPLGTEHPAGRISNHVHDNVAVGDIVDVQAPRGDFHLDPFGTNPVVLIGGGVGVTPVLSMLNAIVKAGSNRGVWFFYAVRNSGDHVLRQHMQNLADTHSNVHLFVCYSEPAESDVTGQGFDRSGYLNADVIREVVKVPNFDFYICGPPPMMSTLVPDLKKWGVTKDRIHTEAFGPATVKKPSTPKTPTTAKKLTVKFSRSGRTVVWDGSDESLLDLANNNGIPIDSGCRAGSCGTCLVAVKQGTTDATIEADAECGDGSCLTCVSVPSSDLVLDA